MVLFHELERLGLSCAAMSDRSDGDCGWASVARDTREAFLRAVCQAPNDLVAPRQHHSNTVVRVSAVDRGRGAFTSGSAVADADGLVTSVPGLPLGVTVADCVPILLVAMRPRAVGAVHAGREGTLREIAASAVACMKSAYAVEPEQVHALIGPSAGPCCYEVSHEIAGDWEARGLPRRGRYLDLWEANRFQLEQAGVPAGQITMTWECTICGGRFHSYRADRTRMRNLAVVAL